MLITLSIIGIVAAMTMPSLIQKQQRKAYGVQLRKFYSQMTQAILLAENEHGEIENWSRADNLKDDDPEIAGQKNYEEMKAYWNKYYAPHIKTIKMERSIRNGKKNAKIYLADGTTIDAWNGGCMTFSYDVNGDKKPNISGIDQFTFNLCEKRSERAKYTGNNKVFMPSGSIELINRDKALEFCKSSQNCGALLIMYDDFEYKDDYPW